MMKYLPELPVWPIQLCYYGFILGMWARYFINRKKEQ